MEVFRKEKNGETKLDETKRFQIEIIGFWSKTH